MERKLLGVRIREGGRKEWCRRHKMSAKGQHGNGCIVSGGMKRLGTGGSV